MNRIIGRLGLQDETFSTWKVLEILGFRPEGALSADSFPPSSINPMIYDFGNCRLSALQLMSMTSFQEVVLFTDHDHGVWFELPVRVKSLEQFEAFLAYYLDRQIGGKDGFVPMTPKRPAPGEPPNALAVAHWMVVNGWFEEGRKNVHLLPRNLGEANVQGKS